MDGELRIRVPPGIVRVSAWTEAAATGDVVHEVDPARESPLDLELIPTVAIEGTVVDAVTAAPVAGAQVWVETFDDLSHAWSDAEGRYRLERFPVGSGGGFVRCRSARHGTESKGLTVREDGSWRVDVPGRGAGLGDLQAGPPFRLDFELVPARAIVGEVRGPRGQWLAGTRLHAQGYFWIARDIALTDEATAETDERGRFELTSLRTDVSHTVRLEADGFAVQRRLVPPGLEPVSDLGTIVMAWGGELLVSVIGPEGLPVEGSLLTLRPAGLGVEAEGTPPDGEASPHDVDVGAEAPSRDADVAGAPPMVPTDSDGMATFDGLSAGAYHLEVRVDGGPPIGREVELLPPPGVTQVLVELPLEYMTIEGEVLRDGEPVPGIDIRIRGRTSRTTTSDSRGRFVLAGNDSTVRGHSLRAAWTDANGNVWATLVEIVLDRPKFVRLELLPLPEDPGVR